MHNWLLPCALPNWAEKESNFRRKIGPLKARLGAAKRPKMRAHPKFRYNELKEAKALNSFADPTLTFRCAINVLPASGPHVWAQSHKKRADRSPPLKAVRLPPRQRRWPAACPNTYRQTDWPKIHPNRSALGAQSLSRAVSLSASNPLRRLHRPLW